MQRKHTKTIHAGSLAIGGDAPVSVQSMLNAKPEDYTACLEQALRLEAAGCQLARMTVPNKTAAAVLGKVREKTAMPLCADIHFDYKMAIEAVAAGADKIRINPGNIGGVDRVRAVAAACASKNVPIRIGVNGGSLEKEVLAKFGKPTAEAMVESASRHIALLEAADFTDICLSLKASNAASTIEANMLAASRFPYPLHLGVTEAGLGENALLKSAVGIGGLLAMGIGDTIRVSITGDPVPEIAAGLAILQAAGRKERGINLISCPTCGRCGVNLEKIAAEAEAALAGIETDQIVHVAVMGCAVNGPGEAKGAHVGIAAGQGEALLFVEGEIVGKVPEEKAALALRDAVLAFLHRRKP